MRTTKTWVLTSFTNFIQISNDLVGFTISGHIIKIDFNEKIVNEKGCFQDINGGR